MDDKIAGFATYNIIDWKQSHYKFQEGDIVYIYCSKPGMKVRYKCIVVQPNIEYSETIHDEEYWGYRGIFFAREAPENFADPFHQLEKIFHRSSLNQCHKISHCQFLGFLKPAQKTTFLSRKVLIRRVKVLVLVLRGADFALH